jgi:hypothetical protein
LTKATAGDLLIAGGGFCLFHRLRGGLPRFPEDSALRLKIASSGLQVLGKKNNWEEQR